MKTAFKGIAALPPSADNKKHYYPALDGMRGLAILLVVIYHNFNFINYSYFGWLGVDLFFVLSGFLITEILLNTAGQPNFLRNFFCKRALRIFPLYYTCLILALLVLPALFKRDPAFQYYTENQGWLWLFLQNWLYIFKQPEGNGFLNHFWSLAVEEQFYLLWPFIILALRQPKRLLAFLLFILLMVFVLRLYVWLQSIESLPYYNLNTFSRIDGICIGSILALIQNINSSYISRNMKWIVLGFAALNFLFDFVNLTYGFSFPFLAMVGYTTFAMLFGLLVHEGTKGELRWIKTVFSYPVLRFFGRISFGLYIFHWPIYVLLNEQTLKWCQKNIHYGAEFYSSLILTILAIVLSIISYYYFEAIFLKMKNKLNRQQR